VLDAAFLDPTPLTAQQFADLVKHDAEKWKKIVHDSGVQQ
jgi:tripartite-type tricarboxylate transporter receptor subunit TctC